MKSKQVEYHFFILNTDRPATHSWSILDILPKNAVFLFYSFEILGAANFIISDESKIINKILFRLDDFKMFDDK